MNNTNINNEIINLIKAKKMAKAFSLCRENGISPALFGEIFGAGISVYTPKKTRIVLLDAYGTRVKTDHWKTIEKWEREDRRARIAARPRKRITTWHPEPQKKVTTHKKEDENIC